MSEKKKIATLFSGIGAPEQALKDMGLDHTVVFACDIDKEAQEAYLLNHKCKKMFGDINDISPDYLNDLKKENIDLLVFGPPCQPFSSAGKRKGFDDYRGNLFVKAIEILDAMQPKFFIAENVRGIMNQDDGCTFRKLIELMEKAGYSVGFRLLNSLDFGVPQYRQRIFIVGVRKDIDRKVVFPKCIKDSKKLSDILDGKVDRRFYATKKFLQKRKVKDKMMSYDKDFIHCLTNAVARNGSSSEFINYVAAVNYAIGEKRKPTPRECARLHGFPETFRGTCKGCYLYDPVAFREEHNRKITEELNKKIDNLEKKNKQQEELLKEKEGKA